MKLSRIEEDLTSCYGSMSRPSWALVVERYGRRPYRRILERLSELGPISETTDLNDDCSVVVALDAGGQTSCVRLSLVGRYASINDDSGAFLAREEALRLPLGDDLVGALDTEQIELLGPKELAQRIRFGDGSVNLYEALFSSDEAFSA